MAHVDGKTSLSWNTQTKRQCCGSSSLTSVVICFPGGPRGSCRHPRVVLTGLTFGGLVHDGLWGSSVQWQSQLLSITTLSLSVFASVCLDLVSSCHTFLSVTFFCTLHSSCFISVSFTPPLPVARLSLLLSLAIHYLPYSHIQLLCLSHFCSLVSPRFINTLPPSLPACLSVAGVTVLGRPPQGARLPQLLHVWRLGLMGVRDLCTNQTESPLSSTVQSVGRREQQEVKHSRKSYSVVMMQGDIYIVRALIKNFVFIFVYACRSCDFWSACEADEDKNEQQTVWRFPKDMR